MILIAYDGSADADAAIDRAAKLLPGQETAILAVWERIVEVLTRAGSGFALSDVDYEAVDKSAEGHARELAEKGVQRAEQAGLTARAHTQARDTSIAESILAAADEVDADVIVMGTRGLTRFSVGAARQRVPCRAAACRPAHHGGPLLRGRRRAQGASPIALAAVTD